MFRGYPRCASRRMQLSFLFIEHISTFSICHRLSVMGTKSYLQLDVNTNISGSEKKNVINQIIRLSINQPIYGYFNSISMTSIEIWGMLFSSYFYLFLEQHILPLILPCLKVFQYHNICCIFIIRIQMDFPLKHIYV